MTFCSQTGDRSDAEDVELVAAHLDRPFSAQGPVSASGLSSSCPVAETGRTGFFLTVDPLFYLVELSD